MFAQKKVHNTQIIFWVLFSLFMSNKQTSSEKLDSTKNQKRQRHTLSSTQPSNQMRTFHFFKRNTKIIAFLLPCMKS